MSAHDTADIVLFYINYLHKFEITLWSAAIVVFEKLHMLGTSIFSLFFFFTVFTFIFMGNNLTGYIVTTVSPIASRLDVGSWFQSPHEP